jgi:hypothetical protein
LRCRDAPALHAKLFRLWHRFGAGPDVRYGPVTRQQLIEKSIPPEKKFFALAERYPDSGDKDVRSLTTAMFQHFERFFTFLRCDGVEPTNNSAERAPAVRGAVAKNQLWPSRRTERHYPRLRFCKRLRPHELLQLKRTGKQTKVS